MDRGTWRATIHGVSKSRTRLKRLSTHRTKTLQGWQRLFHGSSLTLTSGLQGGMRDDRGPRAKREEREMQETRVTCRLREVGTTRRTEHQAPPSLSRSQLPPLQQTGTQDSLVPRGVSGVKQLPSLYPWPSPSRLFSR